MASTSQIELEETSSTAGQAAAEAGTVFVSFVVF
jgi:hypothetical protein